MTDIWEEKGLVPADRLMCIAGQNKLDISSEAFAKHMDAEDPVAKFRNDFHIPKAEPHTEEQPEAIYMCGNSLGLMPKKTEAYLSEELTKWRLQGVEGHFNGARPWAKIDEFVTGMSAAVVGAKESEVAVMNTLSVNLHLMMTSFYRPQGQRTKILIEADAFCSDHHVVRSQIQLHGLRVEDHLIQLAPRAGEACLRTADILEAIQQGGGSIALVLFGAVQFYTGQAFEMAAITKAAHAQGAYVGFDCAHAFGNFPLQLHAWGVDWAAWCTYKYLNAGPGSIAGAFVHERHALSDLPRLAGWWGQEASTRFAMRTEHQRMPGAKAYMLSNPPVLPTICLLAALEIHTQASMPVLRQKSLRITGYLEMLLHKELQGHYRQLTPADPAQRGCQLSILLSVPGGVKKLNLALAKDGVICDVRDPDVIRVAPVPLYTRYVDVYNFVHKLKKALLAAKGTGKL